MWVKSSTRMPASGSGPAVTGRSLGLAPLVGQALRHLVGVDVGGTFTDVLLMPLDGSRTVLAKVPSTADPAEGVVRGVLEAARWAKLDPGDVDLVLHGTAIATNTVAERRGVLVGALVPRGLP